MNMMRIRSIETTKKIIDLKHKEENNSRQREHIRKLCQEQPDEYAEINRRDLKAYHDRKKHKLII